MKTNIANRDIATLYYRNKYLLVLTVIILLIGGVASLIHLPRLEDPRITTRNATILTFLPGASALRIEALVNQKIEQNLEEIAEIKTIESVARANVSTISIELQDSITKQSNENVFAKIRSRLQNLSTELPAAASVPFLETERAVSAYTLIVAIGRKDNQAVSQTPALNLINRVALDLKTAMLAVPNTEFVRLFGGITEQVVVTPDMRELNALGLTTTRLAQIIAAADSKISAGQLRSDAQNSQIEVSGSLADITRIKQIPVVLDQQGTMLTLADIATVHRGFQTPMQQIAYKDGKQMVFVAVRANERVRVDRWTEQALQAIDDFRAKYAQQMVVDVIFEQNQYTHSRLSELLVNLVLGAMIVVAIVFFTMGWRLALVIGSILPLSCAGTLFAFSLFGQSIHQMSIFGMLIAVGLLIDNAIVMADEVRKAMVINAMRAIDAMRHAIHHLFVPLTASTFTTILGFMPIFLLPGNAGDFVSAIAVSVVLALVFSLLLSMTVIPALTAMSISVGSEARLPWWQVGVGSPSVVNDFKRFTYHALQRPVRYALLAMLLPLTGFALVSSMKVEFFPAADRNMFEVKLYLPADSSIEYSKRQVEIADAAIKQLTGVSQLHWLVGSSTPAVYYNQIPWEDNNSAFAQGVVTALDSQETQALVVKVQQLLNQKLPSARVVVQKFAQGPPAKAPVAFRILGPDLAQLRVLGEQVRAIMHQHPEVVNSKASIEGGQAKLRLNASPAEAQRAGISLVDIATQLQTSLEGSDGGQLLEGVTQLPVRVQMSDAERAKLNTVTDLELQTDTFGESTTAAMLGDIELTPEIGGIAHYNGERVNNVFAYITPNAKAVSISNELLQSIQRSIPLADGYSINVAGESEQQNDAVAGLAIFTPILVTLMIATLILTFRSLALASIVLLVAVLAVGLGMLSLKISGFSLGFNPLIGSIGLAGVAINGSIVVLAAILANAKAKAGDSEEILTQTYLCGRHMIATTLTTIGGFIPLFLFSEGTFWPPLAVIIAGGMGFALPLSMFFTPLAYKIYSNWHKKSIPLPVVSR